MTRAAHRILKADPIMAALIEAAIPFELESRPERAPFEALARAIAHQQLHGVAAERILARFIALFGAEAFPSPQQVLDAEAAKLRTVGFSYAKIAALKDLASKTVSGVVPTSTELQSLDDAQIIERLTSVRGIGRWTVEMMLMFQLRRPDVLPVGDFGVRNGFRLAYKLAGMPTARALAQFGERWKPHRTMAAWYLWRAVELSRQNRLPRHRRRTRVEIEAIKQALKKSKTATPKKPARKKGAAAARAHK